ncbi:MAG: kynureninase [Phototrophicaceae bacterium]
MIAHPFDSLEHAQALDAQDPLAPFREQFAFPDPNLIYLDGNSLGRLPLPTVALAQDLVQRQWGDRLIRTWNEGSWDAPLRIGAKIARLIGAHEDEVIVGDSTSTNLFKLALGALLHKPERDHILTDDLNFPSDLYILQGIASLLGNRHRIERLTSPDGIHGVNVADALNAQTALLTLSHTTFKSAYVYDMPTITAQAHEAGALVLWDLSHSAGSVEVDLNAAQADLAVGCTYKYLNGGPGSPAFLYVRRDLQAQLLNPISGWIGQAQPFAFGLDYTATEGMRRFLTGTPSVISLSLIESGVELLLQAGMDKLRQKSILQTEYFIALWEHLLQPLGYTLNSPKQTAQRGSHVALGHAEGLRIDLALIERFNILPDFRAPNNIRIGIAPIYTRYEDLYRAVKALQTIVEERLYLAFDTPPTVT